MAFLLPRLFPSGLASSPLSSSSALGQKKKEKAKTRALRAMMMAAAAVSPMEAPSIQGRLRWNTWPPGEKVANAARLVVNEVLVVVLVVLVCLKS